ncbi:toxin-activating lysine-acyltransferase [Magnetococcales bacterium HHB-1]
MVELTQATTPNFPRILGGITWLYHLNQKALDQSVSDYYARLLPALKWGQFRYFEQQSNIPVAFFTWAFLSSKVAEQFVSRSDLPSESAWCSGDQLWIMDALVIPDMRVQFIDQLLLPSFPEDQTLYWRQNLAAQFPVTKRDSIPIIIDHSGAAQ